MNLEPISVAYVAVYNAIQPMIPGLDNKFCRYLFDNPDDTINGMSPEGYTISINHKPFPLVVINPGKIIFKSGDIDTLSSYIHKVKKEFKKIGFTTNYSAFGINYEYQLLNLDCNADLWLGKKFLDAKAFNGKEKRCNVISLRFDVNDSELVNISLEPRAGIRNGVFVSINHHHASFFNELHEEENLKALYDKSNSLIEQDYLQFIK